MTNVYIFTIYICFKVQDNVCYNHMGHGYFLEDGSEMNNVLDGNLAMLTRKATGDLEPVDAK